MTIGTFIGAEAPAPGYPFRSPEDIAKIYWDAAQSRDTAEHTVA